MMLAEKVLLISRSLAITTSYKCAFCIASSRRLSHNYVEAQAQPESSINTAANVLLGKEYKADEWTNVTPKIISKVGGIVKITLKNYHSILHRYFHLMFSPLNIELLRKPFVLW